MRPTRPSRPIAASAPILAVSAALLAGAEPAAAQVAVPNFEHNPVHGVEITPDGARLLVVNVPDGKLEVFTLGGALPAWSASIPVGLEPVSVRARTATEAWVVNQTSDTVSVVDLAAGSVVATLQAGNEPCDAVFVGAGAARRAYVSVSRENALYVFDPANRSAAPAVVPLAGSCPRALATDGTRVFAAFFEAGNRSTIAPRPIVDDPTGPWAGLNPPPNTAGGFSPALNPALPPAPPSSLVLNREGNPGNWKDAANVVWNARIPWALHEHGVAVFDPSGGSVAYAQNIANINMGLAVQPGTGKVSVVGHHLTNYIRFEAPNRGVFSRSLVFLFDPLSPPGPTGNASSLSRDLNAHLLANGVAPPYVSNPTPAQAAGAVADPRAIVWKDSSTGYIACMGSANVLRVGGTGTRATTINVGQGPCGLAYDAPRSRLYVLNRFDGTVSSIDTAADAVVGTVPFFDPTPAAIKPGRTLFYDAHAGSKLGIVSCNSCHVDTRSDMQAWDVGDPAGPMAPFSEACSPLGGTCADWHPLKGPLMTQNLADTVGAGPLHWRGDRHDVAAFTAGFVGFGGVAAGPGPAQMQQIADFFASLVREPSPYRTVTDGLPASVPGLTGNPSAGAALFAGPPIGGAIARCVDCHSLPTGGGPTIVPAPILGQSQGLRTPPLRDLYVKTGFDRGSSAGRRGFGFGHDGSFQSVQELLQSHFAPGATPQQRADLEAFLFCFPSGVHPAVGQQLTVDGANKSLPATASRLATFTALAESGAVGLVASGRVGAARRSFQYVRGGVMQSDRLAETTTPDALRLAAAAGGEIMFTVVVAGSERRASIDRDADGALDQDEIDNGSNPRDASSVPPASCRPTFTQGPADAGATIGGSVTLTASASGAVQLRWRRGAADLADSARLSGSGAPSLTITGLTAADAGQYALAATNACGVTVSAPATLTVYCPADFNRSGQVELLDIFGFLAAWFAGAPAADFNGQNGVDLLDIFGFLAAWFGGC